MKADGVSAEVLNPTFALWVPRIPDPAMRRACAEVFNDWIVEYCASASERLLGVGIVPVDDPDWAVNEAKRIIRRGARGIMVPTQPIEGAAPYRSAVYDPFWAVAEEARVPVTLHIVTGRVRDPFTYHGADERVARHGVPRARQMAFPVGRGGAGPGGRPSARVDEMHLPHFGINHAA